MLPHPSLRMSLNIMSCKLSGDLFKIELLKIEHDDTLVLRKDREKHEWLLVLIDREQVRGFGSNKVYPPRSMENVE